jgi:hypothetical protein
VRAGSTWLCLGRQSSTPWMSPRGIMGTPTSSVATGTAFTNAEQRDTVLGNYQFTAELGRRYRIWYADVIISGTAGDTAQINVRDSGSASTPTLSSTLMCAFKQYIPVSGGTGQESMTLATTVFNLSSGVHTLGAFGICTTSANLTTPLSNIGIPRQLYVEDIGGV